MASPSENGCSVIYANIPDSTTAEDMAEAILVRDMAATVSIIPEVKTFKISRKHGVKEKPELIMMIKTRTSLVRQLTDFIRLNCPYKDDKVDITSVPISDGNQPFLKWIYDVSDFGTTPPNSEEKKDQIWS